MGDTIQAVAGIPWPDTRRAFIDAGAWTVAGPCPDELHPGGMLVTFSVPMPDGASIDVDVVLGIGPPTLERDMGHEVVRVPLSGHAPCGGAGFPPFEGFVAARPIGAGTGTELVMHIVHHRPLGPLGADGDHVIGTRILDVGLTRLLHQMVHRLEMVAAPRAMADAAAGSGAIRT